MKHEVREEISRRSGVTPVAFGYGPWKINQPTDISDYLAKGGKVMKLKPGQSASLPLDFNPYPWILSEDNPARQIGPLRSLK